MPDLNLLTMDVPGDKEDVDVFVSPKRFGGHTPAAKATRQKVFEDNLKRASLQQETSRSLQSNSERLKYTYRGQKDGKLAFLFLAAESCHGQTSAVNNEPPSILSIC